MALYDLSFVTRTLVAIVKQSIAVSPGRPPQTVNVTSLPPDRLHEDDNAIGIYMYHLSEEPQLTNQVWPQRPVSPTRYSPLGLNLHFIVSAHSKTRDSEGPYREQLLMGLATKALHDFPVVVDATEVGGALVMPPDMRDGGNRVRVSLRRVPADQAIGYWTAGSQPLRLSSYYEVSVVLLEPDEPTTASGRVLAFGVDGFIGGLPRLLATRSVVAFQIPGEAAPRSVELQPAQVAIGDELTLVGEALGGGAVELLVGGVAVGPAWGASGFGDTVTATVAEDVAGKPSIPGTYTASLRTVRTVPLSNGTSHVDVVVSNEAAFQIAPAVTSISAPDPTGVFTVTGQIFQDPSIETTRASIGAVALAVGTLGSLQPGEFAVASRTAIQMRVPAGAAPGAWLPMRIAINGSESPPRWVQVP